MISKLEEDLWDIDIKKVGVSHARQNACIIVHDFSLAILELTSKTNLDYILTRYGKHLCYVSACER